MAQDQAGGKKSGKAVGVFAGFEDAWDEIPEEKSKAKNDFAAMLAESMQGGKAKRLKVGDKIRGEILVIGKEDVFVSTGTSTDGQAKKMELLDGQGEFTKKVGDKLDLFVVHVKGTEVLLSPKPTAKNLSDDIVEAFQKRMAVEGKVTELCKGGVRVQIMGKFAFCPISQLDVARTETGEEFIGRKLQFRITQLTEGGRNIVVSRRKLLDEEREVTAGAFLTEHKPGDVVKGKVSRLEKFGAFVELAPAIDGLVHVSEISWSRVGDPAEVLSVGQEVLCKILKMEPKERKVQIGLSIKQVGAEPWEDFPAFIAEGLVVNGKVTRLEKFGAFVELSPGIEGLIPMSEMSFTKRVMHAEDVLRAGEKVNVLVKDVNRPARRISLSLKEAGDDPWAPVASKYPVGTIVEGVVEKREAYGLFVRLEEGVVGLLPKSKALESSEFPFDKLRHGDKVKVRVLEIRRDERRMTLCPPEGGEGEDWRAFVSTAASGSTTGSGFGTLADKLKAALEKKTK